MKQSHFEALAPVCPVCRPGMGEGAPLTLAAAWAQEKEIVLEGVLRCTSPACQCEFPILDGIPIIVPNPRAFVAANSAQLAMRDDLTPNSLRTLVECAGPGSWLEAAVQHISNYAWDHYAQFDPQEGAGDPKPGAVARVVAAAAPHLRPRGGPVVDIGCSVGRASFELAAATGGLVLGIDTHIPMLRLAQRILRSSEAAYLRRSSGLLYEHRTFPVGFQAAHAVDFWACDATALPFSAATISGALSLNVLDCVASPLDHLRSLENVLAPGATAVITTPYDWSAAATPIEAWVGGHSPRGFSAGRPADVLRSILKPGEHPASLQMLQLVGEQEHFPWHVRVHDRAVMHYDLHLSVVEGKAHQG